LTSDDGNGLHQLLKGSHKLDRIDHIAVGDQQGADPERVELARKQFDEVYFVAEPEVRSFCVIAFAFDRGNFSNERRLVFASCFTREDNVQWKDAYIPCFPCPVVDDDALVGDGHVHLTSEEDKVMLGADVG